MWSFVSALVLNLKLYFLRHLCVNQLLSGHFKHKVSPDVQVSAGCSFIPSHPIMSRGPEMTGSRLLIPLSKERIRPDVRK